MKVAAYIRNLLIEGQEVVVPGFGTFTCKKLPAEFDKERMSMLPPRV